MSLGEIYCALCGWQNESTARMCGGCGAPLRASEPGAVGAYAQPGITYPSEGVGNPALYAPDAPTTVTPTAPDALAVGAWPGVPAPASAREKPRTHRGRLLIIVGVVLAALLISTVGAWAMVIQPTLHNEADTQLRSALTSAVGDVPVHAPAGHYFIRQNTMNDLLQQFVPVDAPIKNVQARFSDGAITFTYSFLGASGSVTTQPYVSDGKLQVQGTRVDGPLSLVESGDQLENAFNDALSKIPEQGKIQSFSIVGDRLEITIVS